MDRYSTSVTIAQSALEKKITIVGTMRLDRKGIPKEIKSLENREERSILYVFDSDENILLVSYIDKKKSGKRNNVALSTLHDKVRVTKDERRKPDIHKLYDHTKGGVDVVNLISTSCTTRIKNKKWSINASAFILDTVRTNAKTILQESTAKLNMSNFEFTYALGKLLVLPQIERRYANPNGLQIDLMQCIRRVLGIPEVNRRVVTSTLAKSGLCYASVEDLVGTNMYKDRREKLNTSYE